MSTPNGHSSTEPRPAGPHRIVLADQDPATRLRLQALLRNRADLVIRGDAGSIRFALQAASFSKPDVVIAETNFCDGDIFELIRELRGVAPTTRLLVLSRHHENVYAERVLRAGAMGYVMKSAPASDILVAIRTVAAGRHYFGALARVAFLRNFLYRKSGESSSNDRRCPLAALSTREFQVIQMVGSGMDQPAIAAATDLSERLIDHCCTTAAAKLGIGSAEQFDWLASECACRCRIERALSADDTRQALDPRCPAEEIARIAEVAASTAL